ncbi:MAG: histidine phosphatase family protein, partial [Jatrophihabitans sp.]
GFDFGELEGLSFEQARQRWPAEHAAWIGGRPDAAPPGGESVEQVAGRAERALRRVLVEHRGRTVVLVAHATPIKLLVCSALGGGAASFFRLQVDTGGLCWIDWYGPDTAVVRHLNDTGQLP